MGRRPIIAITLVCACGRLDFDPQGDAGSGLGPDAGPVEFGPWGNLRPLSEVNSTAEEITPSLSFDACELYFASTRMGGSNMVLFRSSRPDRDSIFGPPVAIDVGAIYAAEPALAKSGLVMYLQTGGTQITRITRATSTSAWSTSTPVTELVSSAGVYFSGADFAGDDLRVVLNDFNLQTYVSSDLYETTRPDLSSPWLPPHVIAELVTPDNVGYPTLRGDGLELVFHNDSLGGRLYSAKRSSVDSPFEPPQALDLGPSLVGKPAQDPEISDDGTILIFNVLDGPDYNLYMVTRSPL